MKDGSRIKRRWEEITGRREVKKICIWNLINEGRMKMKIKVKNELEKELNMLMQKAKTSEEAKNIIKENIPFIRNTVDKFTKDNKVSFGKNPKVYSFKNFSL